MVDQLYVKETARKRVKGVLQGYGTRDYNYRIMMSDGLRQK
jgi:hypothetical protein